jgi:hypothetical protein
MWKNVTSVRHHKTPALVPTPPNSQDIILSCIFNIVLPVPRLRLISFNHIFQSDVQKSLSLPHVHYMSYWITLTDLIKFLTSTSLWIDISEFSLVWTQHNSTEAPEEGKVKIPCIPNFCTGWRWVVSFMLRLPLLSGGKNYFSHRARTRERSTEDHNFGTKEKESETIKNETLILQLLTKLSRLYKDISSSVAGVKFWRFHSEPVITQN